MPLWDTALNDPKCQTYPIHVWLLFHSISVYGQQFSSYRIFLRQVFTWPLKLTLSTNRSKEPIYTCMYVFLVYPKAQFSSFHDQLFSLYMWPCDQCADDTKVTLNTTKSKVVYIPCVWYYCLEVGNFPLFLRFRGVIRRKNRNLSQYACSICIHTNVY